jgi:hypothetical protein
MELERFEIGMPISHLIHLINHQSASMDPLMMLVESHHSLSFQKDSSSNDSLHQKEKDTRKYHLFFSFFLSFL